MADTVMTPSPDQSDAKGAPAWFIVGVLLLLLTFTKKKS